MRVSHNTQSMAILSIFFTILLFFSLPLLTTTQSLADDRSALLSLRSAVKGRTLLWNTTQSSPCSWPGVTCDDGDRVTVLRLPGVSLSGNIPEGIFGNLTNLRTLSLRLNALKGSLPSDLSLCSDLRHVYLQGNRFSGEIPQILFTLENLRRLSLADNDFSGEISSDFKNLTRLKTLFLQNNKLSGSIPDLDLPLIQFNVSNNSKLNGSIPKNLQRFDSDSFLQTSLCGEPLQICDAGEATVPSQPTSGGNKPPPIINQKKKKISGGVIAGIAIGSVIGFFALILVILLLLCRRKNKEKSREISVEKTAEEEESDGNANANVYSVSAAAAAAMTGNAKPKERNGVTVSSKKLTFFGNATTANTKVFDLEDLLRASAEVLGKGAFGTAYKAVVDAVTIVAVKRLKEFVKMEEKEFREKIEFVGKMDSHENLVTLRAYYLSRDEKLLVYDYFPMGSLSALLHGGNRGSLNLDARTRIALGAARGLDYLHSQGTATSHGNFKSSNILLTKSRDAKVSDFGLANLVGSSSPHSTTNPNRVTGYLAPEVTDPKRVSKKGDVYSFGVVLLELITGKAPTNSVMNEEGVDLVRWVRSVARDEWRREVYDAEIVTTTTTEEEEEVVAEMVELGIECTAQHPDKRPEMVGVVKKIEDLRRCFFGSGSDHVEEAD